MQDVISAKDQVYDQVYEASQVPLPLAGPPAAKLPPGAPVFAPAPAPPLMPGRPLPVSSMPGMGIEVATHEAARARASEPRAGARPRGAAAGRAAASAAARALIAAYFVNAVYTAVETWHIFATDPKQVAGLRRWASDPEPRPPAFPWLLVAVLLPAALVSGLWPRPMAWPAVPLLLFTAWQDGGMALRQMRAVLLHGSRPTELLVKPLAICGAAALLLASAVREARRARGGGAVAGPLAAGDAEFDASARAAARPRRSALLLAGRLLMALLLAFAGWMQLQRMYARASAPPPPPGAAQHFGRADPRDNPLVLAECALGLLLALGLGTRPAAACLAAVLVAEAALYWRFWGPAANFAHRQHARERFFTALALAGGAAQLAALGAGGLSVDAAAAARKRQ